MAGLVMDPWQALCLDAILKERADGKWAAREAGYLVGRQNGKGGILSALALAALFLFDDVREILFSAHEFKTAKKAYRDVKGLIEGTPSLLALVERRGNRIVGFRQSNEDTSITLADEPLPGGKLRKGTVLRFMARSSNTARGFSPQLVIADEAQECSQEARSALFYTVRAQPNPLVVWCGTVPGPKNQGAVFRGLRDRGRAGGDPSMAWLEWTPEPGRDPKSREAIIESTPGMPYRVSLETVEAERAAAEVDPEAWEAWLREALSIWPDETDEIPPAWAVWPEQVWADCASHEDDLDGPGWLTGAPSLAVEVAHDRSAASLVAVGDCREGGLGIELVAHAEGIGWVTATVQKLTADPAKPLAHVVIDPKSPALTLIEPLRDAGVTVTECTFDDLRAATGHLYDAVLSGKARHRKRPALTLAVSHASMRTSGDAWLFDRRTGMDTSAISGAAVALVGHLAGVEESVDLTMQVF